MDKCADNSCFSSIVVISMGVTKGQTDIILVPSPSEDPEDPLNWTFQRKALATSCVVVYTITIALPSSAVYSIVTPIRAATSLTLADINNGTGIMVCPRLMSLSQAQRDLQGTCKLIRLRSGNVISSSTHHVT